MNTGGLATGRAGTHLRCAENPFPARRSYDSHRTKKIAASTVLILCLVASLAIAQETKPAVECLPGTQLLTDTRDLAMEMVAGIDRFFTQKLAASVEQRETHWQRDYGSPDAYAKSVEPNRQRLARIIGAVDARVSPIEMQLVATTTQPARVADREGYTVEKVRWPVLDGVDAEGLLLQPKGKPVARVVALPDADASPEMLAGLAPGIESPAQFARRLAENGCQVLIPTLIDRSDTWSGNPKIRMTNQPHREFIYRMAFEMGRHIIGYEVDKVLAAVDWFCSLDNPNPREISNPASDTGRRRGSSSGAPPLRGRGPKDSATATDTPVHVPIGVIGCGEGGLIALYAAAVDTRIDAACVSGYFQSRQDVWAEPIYRNVWGLLDEFGDAEVASLIAPRPLLIDAGRGPEIDGPPPVREGRRGAAPGRLISPPLASVTTEFDRAKVFYEKLGAGEKLILLPPPDVGEDKQGTRSMLREFLGAVGHRKPLKAARPQGADKVAVTSKLPRPGGRPADKKEEPETRPAPRMDPAAEARVHRQFDQLVEYTQKLVRQSEARRREFWAKADASSVEKWQDSCKWYRDYFWDEVIGRCEPASVPANPRTRRAYDNAKWAGYEVVLDVWPDVFAYGILLVPKDLKPGERRPVVVCQHGLEGRAQVTCDAAVTSQFYHAFGAQLADRGFIVYAPQNPYIGEEKFRIIQRKTNPLKRSLFSVIVRQHERTLQWLAEQPFVDPQRSGSTASPTAARRRCASPRCCRSTACQSARAISTSGSAR